MVEYLLKFSQYNIRRQKILEESTRNEWAKSLVL